MLFSSMVMVTVGFSVWLVGDYAHVFVLLSVLSLYHTRLVIDKVCRLLIGHVVGYLPFHYSAESVSYENVVTM